MYLTIQHYLLLLLDTFGAALFISIMLKDPSKRKMLLFVAIDYSLIHIRDHIKYNNLIIVQTVLMTYFPILIIQIAIIIAYRQKISRAILTSFIYMITSFLYQFVLVLVSYPLKYVTDTYDNPILYNRIMSWIYIFSMIFLSYHFRAKLAGLYDFILRYLSSTKKFSLTRIKTLFVIVMCFLLAASFLYLYLTADISGENTLPILLIALTTIFIILISFYENMMSAQETKVLEEKNALLLQNLSIKSDMESSSQLHYDYVQSMNQFGHSYNNMLQAIQYFIQNDSNTLEEVRSVLFDLMHWNDQMKLDYKLKHIGIPNLLISSILSIKLEQAEKSDIEFCIDYSGEENVPLNSKDLMDVCYSMFDLALDCAKQSDSKKIKLEIAFLRPFQLTLTYPIARNDIMSSQHLNHLMDLAKYNNHIHFEHTQNQTDQCAILLVDTVKEEVSCTQPITI